MRSINSFEKNKIQMYIVWGVGLIALLLVNLPLFSAQGNMHTGDDLWYHLLRIENVKEGLIAGQFPVRMGTNYLNHHGYASSLCYPELFLYIPAVLRIMGMSVAGSYKAFIILLNMSTFVATYYCGWKISGNKIAGVIAASIVLLSPYHLANIYLRGALGETQAYVFFPLVVLGLYELIFEEFEHPWIMGLGFWGLMYSHSISLAIALCVCVVASVICFRRVFLNQKKVIRVMITAVIVLLASCSFWGALLEQLVTSEFNFSDKWTSVVDQALDWRKIVGVTKNRYTFGCIFLALCGCGALCLFPKWGNKKDDRIKVIWLFALGGICLYACTKYFPWTIAAKLLNSIQFPWRIYAIASLFLALGIGYVLAIHFEKYARIVCLIVTGIMAIEASLYIKDNRISYVNISSNPYVDMMDTFSIVQAEWLPKGVEIAGLTGERVVIDQEKNSVDYEVDRKGHIWFYASGDSAYYDVPFLLYRGYSAVLTDEETGSRTELRLSNEGRQKTIRVYVPEQITGTIEVGYTGTFVQKACDVVTLLTIVVFALYMGNYLRIQRKRINDFEKTKA